MYLTANSSDKCRWKHILEEFNDKKYLFIFIYEIGDG